MIAIRPTQRSAFRNERLIKPFRVLERTAHKPSRVPERTAHKAVPRSGTNGNGSPICVRPMSDGQSTRSSIDPRPMFDRYRRPSPYSSLCASGPQNGPTAGSNYPSDQTMWLPSHSCARCSPILTGWVSSRESSPSILPHRVALPMMRFTSPATLTRPPMCFRDFTSQAKPPHCPNI